MPKCHQSVLLKPGYVLESPRSVVILHLIRSSEMRSRPEPLSELLVYVDCPSRCLTRLFMSIIRVARQSRPPSRRLNYSVFVQVSAGACRDQHATRRAHHTHTHTHTHTNTQTHTHTHTHTRLTHTHTHTHTRQRARVRVVWHTFSVSPGWTTTASPTCAVTCSPSLSPFLSFSSPLLHSSHPPPVPQPTSLPLRDLPAQFIPPSLLCRPPAPPQNLPFPSL